MSRRRHNVSRGSFTGLFCFPRRYGALATTARRIALGQRVRVTATHTSSAVTVGPHNRKLETAGEDDEHSESPPELP